MDNSQSSTDKVAEQQQADMAVGSLPLPYVLDSHGNKQPLPGSKSIFLRSSQKKLFADPSGGTAEAMGLSGLGRQAAVLMLAVSREKILADIQFQGAISDFHPIKDAIKAADYEELLMRVNEEDVFGDGNNFEVAVSRATADAWQAADEAAQQAAAAEAAAAEEGAAVTPSPRSRTRRDPRPWQDQGSQAELAEAGVFSSGSCSSSSAAPAATTATSLLLSRPLRAFGAPVALADASSSELWASNTMEARPFKDANYELHRMLQDTGMQAVPELKEAAVQATGGRPRPGSTQTVPRQLPVEQLDELVMSAGFNAFLEAVQPRLDEALLQNCVGDILADDLQLLGDDEGEGVLGHSSSGSGSRIAAAAGSGGGAGGGVQEHGKLAEAQSFTDLTYSRNKVVSAICWVPHRKGVVACACTDPTSQTDRLATMGRLAPAFILVWNFKDPIHPEYVMESPQEVYCFQYNPLNPNIVSAGCYNGQTVVWDTTGADVGRAVGASARSSVAGGWAAGGSWEDGAAEEHATPIIKHKFMSAVEHSHTMLVSDICWLPGMEVDRAGKVFNIRANSAGTSAQAMVRSMTLGAAALAAAAAGSNVPRECCFFASIAADGKVMFWDVRIDKLLKKGNKRMDDTELVWKPMHVVHLLSVASNDFAGCRFSFDPYRLDSGNFSAGSLDGELLVGNFIRPPGEDNPDYTRCVFAPHVGPIVALSASPFLPDVLLSVGDWTFRLWQGLDSKVPVFTSPYADEAYTAATWSPTRPGLLFLATAAGSLQVWDLLDRSHEPSLTINTASTPITSLSFSSALPKHATHATAHLGNGSGTELPRSWGSSSGAADSKAGGGGGGGSSTSSSSGAASGEGVQHGSNPSHHHGGGGGAATGHAGSSGLQVLAVGDAAGVLHLFELPRTLRRPLPNERRLMAAFIAREAARVSDVEARQPLRAAMLKSLQETKKAAEDGSSSGAAPAGIGQVSSSDSAGGPSQQATSTLTATSRVSLLGTADGVAVPAAVVSRPGGPPSGGRKAGEPAAAGMGPGAAAGVVGAGGRSGSSVSASAADTAALEKAEKTYRAREAEFKQALGLAAAS